MRVCLAKAEGCTRRQGFLVLFLLGLTLEPHISHGCIVFLLEVTGVSGQLGKKPRVHLLRKRLEFRRGKCDFFPGYKCPYEGFKVHLRYVAINHLTAPQVVSKERPVTHCPSKFPLLSPKILTQSQQ